VLAGLDGHPPLRGVRQGHPESQQEEVLPRPVPAAIVARTHRPAARPPQESDHRPRRGAEAHQEEGGRIMSTNDREPGRVKLRQGPSLLGAFWAWLAAKVRRKAK
jgi:hypothetical protein